MAALAGASRCREARHQPPRLPPGYRWIAVRPGAPPPPRRGRRSLGPTPRYAVIPRWDYVAFAKSVGIQFARSVNTATDFDAALAGAKAQNGPALIAARIDPHSAPV